MQNERKIGADMIPEIEDKFKIINWLREQKHIHNGKFMRLPRCEQSRMINQTYMISDLIDKLKYEINEIAKEHGNSYLDEMVILYGLKVRSKGSKYDTKI